MRPNFRKRGAGNAPPRGGCHSVQRSQALQQLARGEGEFRTVENYVFCVGPDGVMSAHPNKALQGTDVRDLRDSTGNHFIATMLQEAKPGQVASIRYLFPRPSGTRGVAKTIYYTRAGSQMCGVGFYDDAETAAAPQPLQARLAQLRASEREDACQPGGGLDRLPAGAGRGCRHESRSLRPRAGAGSCRQGRAGGGRNARRISVSLRNHYPPPLFCPHIPDGERQCACIN